MAFVLTVSAAAHAGTDAWSQGSGLSSPVYAIAADPGAPDTVYAGTTPPGLYRTTDGGTTWTAASTGLPATTVTALAIDPVTPTTLYAETYEGLFKTTNAGGAWTSLGFDPAAGGIGAQEIAIDPANPSTVYASSYDASRSSNSLYKTADGGATWTRILAEAVHSLAIDPSTGTVYALANSAFRSTDGGASWQSFATLPPGFLVSDPDRVIDPDTPTTIYESSSVSLDGGVTWSAERTGLPPNVGPSVLAISSGTPRRLYGGTNAGPYQMDLVCNRNGVVDPGEQCDDGSNGAPLTCCSVMCNIRVGSDCSRDDDVCTQDICNAAGVCTHPVAPSPCSFGGPRTASLLLKTAATGQTRAAFKWTRGDALDLLPDPAVDGGTALCVYEQTGPDTYAIALRGSPSVAGGGSWIGSATTSWRFKSPTGAPDGVTTVTLKPSARDLSRVHRSSVQVKLNGNPAFPLGLPLETTYPVVAQFKYALSASSNPAIYDSVCWSASFATSKTNTPTQFKATNP